MNFEWRIEAPAGKAWAAINNAGELVALKHMGDFEVDTSRAPAWVLAVEQQWKSLRDVRIEHLSPTVLSRMKKSAIAAGYPACGPRGGKIKASSIAREARSILNQMEREQFEEYRARSIKKLARYGEVVSGTCLLGKFFRGKK